MNEHLSSKFYNVRLPYLCINAINDKCVSFDSSLIKEKLIDEFYLFINPVAIGNGMTIFKDLDEIQKYTLIESKTFECGTAPL
jgi:hypothetical protein